MKGFCASCFISCSWLRVVCFAEVEALITIFLKFFDMNNLDEASKDLQPLTKQKYNVLCTCCG